MDEARVIGGKYRLERAIGRGGMGAIWVAFDPQLQRRVALKRMAAEHLASATARARFEQEAMAIARLQHPNVIHVYDYGIDDGTPFIAMELLEGEDLDARLRRETRLRTSVVTPLLSQIAKALSVAHEAGIVHRDLKPANIFIARAGSQEVVKLLDFGVAAMREALAGPAAQRAGTLVGTPAYMSPEQALAREDVDHRADLWALGVVLYEVITGELPFTESSLSELITAILTEPHAPPSSRAPDLGPEIDRFFDRALAKEAGHRFQSAQDLAVAFARAIGSADDSALTTKILVVDDEPDIPLLMKQRFRRQIRKSQLEFLFASDGESALDQLRAHPDIDVIFSDINMPGMDGLTLLSRIGEVNPVVKAVMISAYGDMDNVRKAMNRGAFDFLIKPLDFKDFEITLEKTARHVRELRRTVQSAEENDVLRTFVSSGLLERLMLRTRVSDVTPSEIVHATVMVVRVLGLASWVERGLAEEAVWRLNASFDVIVPEIGKESGHVERFLGASLVAVFRDADHAMSAARASVAIRSQILAHALRGGDESPCAEGVAIGIDTGDVLIGSIGAKARALFSYTAAGPVLELAERLAWTAEKNQVLVSEAVRGTVGEAVDMQAIEPQASTTRATYSVTSVTLDSQLDPRNLSQQETVAAATRETIAVPGSRSR